MIHCVCGVCSLQKSVGEGEEADMIIIRGVISEGCSVPGHVAVFPGMLLCLRTLPPLLLVLCRLSFAFSHVSGKPWPRGPFRKRTALLDKQDTNKCVCTQCNNTASAVITI